MSLFEIFVISLSAIGISRRHWQTEVKQSDLENKQSDRKISV